MDNFPPENQNIININTVVAETAKHDFQCLKTDDIVGTTENKIISFRRKTDYIHYTHEKMFVHI